MFQRVYAVVAYLAFLASILYAVAFVGGYVPGLGAAPSESPVVAVAIDLFLVGLFGMQHSVMARAGWKRWFARHAPAAIDRSTYVLASSVFLAVLLWQWRPVGTTVLWDVHGLPAALLVGVSLIGWGIVILATFLLDHAALFGLRQAFSDAPEAGGELRTPLLYKAVRHPIYFGFVIAFWATPHMSLGHFVFAAGLTVYILIAIPLEERDLVRIHGEAYLAYRRRVRALLPF